MRAVLPLLLALTGGLPPTATAAEGCVQARSRLQARDLPGAEAAARACLAAAPEDGATWTVLGRVLAARGQYDQALSWLGRARARFPLDDDIGAEHARVLAWAGRLEEAWQAVQTLGPQAFGERDVAMLAANLALWRNDDAEAERRFSELLARWPEDAEGRRGRGLARQHRGQLAEAQADFDTLCAQGAGCALASDLGRRLSRLRLRLAPGLVIVPGRHHGWDLVAEVEARVIADLHFQVALDRRTRDFGAGPLTDNYAEAAVRSRLGDRAALVAAVGTTFDRHFSPSWTAQIEPSVGLAGGLELMLKYWRISFPTDGAHVVTPAALWQLGTWSLYARYFLALPDHAPVRHAAFGRLARDFGDRVSVWAGGGGGTGIDYLEIHEGASGSFWFGWAGLSQRFGWRHSLRADYVRRREATGNASYVQHNLTVGYELRL
jgi:Flp pilus assembly protein TadD